MMIISKKLMNIWAVMMWKLQLFFTQNYEYLYCFLSQTNIWLFAMEWIFKVLQFSYPHIHMVFTYEQGLWCLRRQSKSFTLLMRTRNYTA